MESNNQQVIAILAEVKAVRGKEEELAGVIAGLVERTHAKDNPLVYDCLRADDDPARFIVYEVFASQEDLQSHLGNTMAEFVRENGDLMEGNISSPADIPATFGRRPQAAMPGERGRS